MFMFGRCGFGDALAVEHLVAHFLINLEATFDPSFRRFCR